LEFATRAGSVHLGLDLIGAGQQSSAQ
jgi:hypothetical protein